MPAVASTETRTRWIDVQDAASVLDMSERTVRHLCAKGELDARKFGRAWRIRRGDVMPEKTNA
jgi:excisionase family DNA binding protein